jgi:SAM-dependent methyltransferase
VSPAAETNLLDLACGTGEMLCTWARDHRLTGIGVDISTVFIGSARARAAELGVADRVTFVRGDASVTSPVSRSASPRASARPGSAGALLALSACSDAASPLAA